jgi:long-chain acyl-CoA synthetase
MEIRTLNDIYTVTTQIERPVAMKVKKGDQWVDISVADFRDTVRWFSTGLRVLGVKPGDRVGMLSENRPEWAEGDFAILALGAVTVPIYPTLLGWQIEYIINDSSAVAIVCSTDEQLRKVLAIRAHCPSVHNIIVCDPPPDLPYGVLTFDQVVKSGREEEEKSGRARFDELMRAAKPDTLATLVYTSGTTGNPKGAMLTHGNIASNVAAANILYPLGPEHTALSILPLSHILDRLAAFFFYSKGV